MTAGLHGRRVMRVYLLCGCDPCMLCIAWVRSKSCTFWRVYSIICTQGHKYVPCVFGQTKVHSRTTPAALLGWHVRACECVDTSSVWIYTVRPYMTLQGSSNSTNFEHVSLICALPRRVILFNNVVLIKTAISVSLRAKISNFLVRKSLSFQSYHVLECHGSIRLSF